jgi:Fe-S cluster biogenesis protein NfuA
MREKLEAALNKIRTELRGADVRLMGYRDGVVKVKIWVSGCGAGMPEEIVLEMLEEQLKKEVPEVKEVIAV